MFVLSSLQMGILVFIEFESLLVFMFFFSAISKWVFSYISLFNSLFVVATIKQHQLEVYPCFYFCKSFTFMLLLSSLQMGIFFIS